MLSPDDSAIIAGDRALSGLETVLDEEAMLDIIRGLSRGASVATLRARYVRYKPGTSCIVGFSAEIEGGRMPLYARTHAAGALGKLAKALQRNGPPGSLGFGVAALRNRELVIFEAPNDDVLRSLPKLVRSEAGQLRGGDVMLHQHSIEGARVTPLRYKPERRFVAKIDQADRSCVLKVYSDEDFETIRNRGKQFASRGPLIVAEPVGHRARHRALLFNWMDGESLLQAAQRDAAAGALGALRLGEALRVVHEHRPSKSVPKCDAACLGAWIATELAMIDRVLSGTRAGEVARSISPVLNGHEWRKVGLHGDFSHDQALITAQGVVVFDFDRAMRGEPWLDLGRFIASLELEWIRGSIDERARDVLVEQFMEGYGRDEESAVAEASSFVAAQLLLRVLEPFRLRWPDWRTACDRILSRAAELAGSSSSAHR